MNVRNSWLQPESPNGDERLNKRYHFHKLHFLSRIDLSNDTSVQSSILMQARRRLTPVDCRNNRRAWEMHRRAKKRRKSFRWLMLFILLTKEPSLCSNAHYLFRRCFPTNFRLFCPPEIMRQIIHRKCRSEKGRNNFLYATRKLRQAVAVEGNF